MSQSSEGILSRLERWGTAVENGIMVLLLAAMMMLAVGQIVLRVFFSGGFVWADELLKLMVLWIAMVASIAAARSNRHLRIDIVSHFVPEKYARVPVMLVDLFASFMCGVLAWQSYKYVQLSVGDTVLVDFPAWLAYSILPVAFGIMCYRFLLSFIAEMRKLLRAGGE